MWLLTSVTAPLDGLDHGAIQVKLLLRAFFFFWDPKRIYAVSSTIH